MKIVVSGGGAVGKQICRDLLKLGDANNAHEITIVDFETHEMQRHPVTGVEWISGDCCDPDTLTQAKVNKADVYVVATGDDQTNLVSSMLAKTEFGVPKTIARINHPKNSFLFDKSWGVDFAISMPEAMTTLIEEAVSEDELVPVLSFTTSKGALFKYRISETSTYAGVSKDNFLNEVQSTSENTGKTTTLCAIIREDSVIAPYDEVILETGDELILLVV